MFFNFSNSKPFGLDISDYSIEIASLRGSLENPRLSALGRTVLRSGICEDGEILKKEHLAKALGELINNFEFGKISTEKFIFSLPESKTFICNFELPKDFPEKEIEERVRFEAAENFPYSLSEIYFDYRVRDGKVFLTAAPRKIIDSYLEVFKFCGLKPVVLETESLSLARVLLEKREKPILILDIGARTANLNIFDENGLNLSFSSPAAGEKFTRSLAEKLNISKESAEHLKKRVGLDLRQKEGKVFFIIQKELQEIIKEINRAIYYYESKSKKKVDKMILAGGSSSLLNLEKYFQENLEIKVEKGDPWKKINIDILKKKEYFKEALEVNPILYSAVLGSALRGLENNPEKSEINLLPKNK